MPPDVTSPHNKGTTIKLQLPAENVGNVTDPHNKRATIKLQSHRRKHRAGQLGLARTGRKSEPIGTFSFVGTYSPKGTFLHIGTFSVVGTY
jgi:hypothetical protein